VTALPRVLFVDDEPRVLEAIERDLFDDYHVVTATSGQAGLEALDEQGPFQVVVSDMRMPSMDGATFLTEVRSRHPEVVRILLTGYADIEAVVAAVNSGNIFRYLQKPCPHDTLRAALEEALAEHRRRVADSERVDAVVNQTRRLIDSLSHELNTPLAAVQGLAQALHEQGASLSGPEQAELLEIIAAQSAELSSTIRDLMVVGRSAVGALAVRSDTVDVLELLRACRAAAPGELRVEGEPTWVSADPERLRRAVDLLVDNAFRHGSPPVVASVARLPHGVSIAVRDRGAGIADDLAPGIFEPFVTGTGDRPGKATSGLGLAVARGLARAMGGSVGHHRLGDWTVFELVVPLEPPPDRS
jgi:signal transduction histidine kinase